MSKPRDRRNPAPPSAKHDIPKASTWSPSWSLSWYRSSSLSSSSERTPESRRKGCGRDVEKRRDARSLTATRETRGRLIPQAEPQPEPQPEPQAELQSEVSRNSILALGRRTRRPGRHSEWGAASLPGGFVAGESISAFYLPSDKESTSGHHLKASAFMLSLPTPISTTWLPSALVNCLAVVEGPATFCMCLSSAVRWQPESQTMTVEGHTRRAGRHTS
jgi:hypothetical protein